VIKERRNAFVEEAVKNALDCIDRCIAGACISELPSAENRAVCDGQLEHNSASVRVASLFLAWYSTADARWNCNRLPIGYRGTFGDKLLSTSLTLRKLTLHNAITAFGENLGWKGNKTAVRLSSDNRFAAFSATLSRASHNERLRMATYMAAKFAESRQELRPIPPIAPTVLTFARAKKLLFDLLSLQSEGHVQQFLVAALLKVHRRRYGYEIRTHHPHAADTYDHTAGDIEEFHNDELVRAYEVTVRPDWKNRVTGFRNKMDSFGLTKYIIIASDVNSDDELAEPARLIAFLQPFERDLAVVDIRDVLTVMAAELSANELRDAVNFAYDFLCQPSMCGRPDFQSAYREVVGQWLDSISP